MHGGTEDGAVFFKPKVGLFIVDKWKQMYNVVHMSFERGAEKERQIQVIKAVLAGYTPTKSGATFSFRDGVNQLIIHSPVREYGSMDDEELIVWYEDTYHINYRELAHKMSPEEYRAEVVKEAKYSKQREFIGGLGLTARSLDEVEEEIPTSTKALEHASGRVIFIGNGLSDAPLFLAEKFHGGKIDSPPIIVDMFDYEKLYEDLAEISRRISDMMVPLPFPLEENSVKLGNLIKALRQGDLIAVNYCVGSNSPPEILQGASMIINCHGPATASIEDQLSLLAPGGSLYTTYHNYSPEGGAYQKRSIIKKGKTIAAVITKA